MSLKLSFFKDVSKTRRTANLLYIIVSGPFMRLMHIDFRKSIAELCEYNTFNVLQIKSLSKEKKIKYYFQNY